MASILQRIVTLLGDTTNWNHYTYNGSNVYRSGQLVATYRSWSDSSAEYLEIKTIDGGLLTTSFPITEQQNPSNKQLLKG